VAQCDADLSVEKDRGVLTMNQTWVTALFNWLFGGSTKKEQDKAIDDLMEGVDFDILMSDSVWHKINKRYRE